ncbi:MAG: hypothetical protein J6R59_16100 [Paludibacteraceae bacterium]|jgi:hypothetical protein|nr:hypothetical protein [Paludibacteraceae bacterium]
MNDLKEKLSEYLNKIPVVERKTYVILLCSLLILGFATKSVIKIVRTSEGWENLSTGDNQTISQDQLDALSSELNRVHDHFSASRDSFLMLVDGMDTLNIRKNDEN